MTEQQRQRVLAGRPLIPDDDRDKRWRCPTCGQPIPIPNMPHCRGGAST